jgi:dipeptidyl aminopeptidase/acylaminoacyl peptidase
MRRFPISVLAFMATIAVATTVFAAGITPTQLLDLQHVRSADISPDGKTAAFTLNQNRTLDDDAGGGWSQLFVVSTDGGIPRPFVTGEVSVGKPSFSPDGLFIGFTQKRGADAKTQVWTIPLGGGEAQAVTASETGVSAWSWSHDGASIFYTESEATPADEKDLKDKGFWPEFYEEILRDRLLSRTTFTWGTEAAEGETLVEGLAVWGLHTDATGQFLVFGASANTLTDQHYMFQDIYLMDLATGSYHVLVDVPGKLGDYRLSPDGKRLAFTAAASRSDHSVSSLFVANVGSQQTQPVNLTPENFKGHIRHVTWRDNKTLMYQSDVGVYPTVSLQDARKTDSNAKVIFDGSKNGLIVGMPASRPGTKSMVIIGQNASTPSELYSFSAKGKTERLTQHNEYLSGVALGEQRVVTWKAKDGLELEGILMLPVGYKGGRFPLLVQVHGGPEANHTNGWLSRYASPGQAFCAQGFGVFFTNYRGSTGRGVAFAASAFADPAGKEFDDIIDGIDYLIAEGLADGDKVGVIGGSYGGYAANWMSTFHSERFKAAISFVGVSDQVSKRFLTDIPFEDLYVHMGKPVMETWELMRERSPISHVGKSTTPLLLLHGDSDPRVHPSQSQEMYRAMKMAGHPAVRLIFYPGEGHGNSKRFGREDFVFRTMAWFDYYLLQDKTWNGAMPALDISRDMGLTED